VNVGPSLTFGHRAFYVKDRRTATVQRKILCVQSTNTNLMIFYTCCTKSVYSSTKCRVVHNVDFFFSVHKIFTFDINGVLKFKFPTPGPRG